MRIYFKDLVAGQIIFQIFSKSFIVYFIDELSGLSGSATSLEVDVDKNKINVTNIEIGPSVWNDTICNYGNLYADEPFRRYQAIWAIFEGRWT